MRLVKHLVHNYVIVGLSLVSIYLFFALEYHLPVHTDYALFLFSAAVSGYFWLQWMHFTTLRYECKTYYRQFFRFSLAFFILNVVILFVLLFRLPVKLLVWIIPFGLILFFYNLRPSKKILAWRTIGLVKVLLVAFVWSGLTVFIPSVLWTNAIPFAKWTEVFLLVWMLMIPFDIRDLMLDAESIKTIPALGSRSTFIFTWVLFFLYVLTGFYVWFHTHNLPALLIKITGGVIIITGVVLSRRYRSYYFTAFWVELIPVFMFLLLLCWYLVH